MKRKFITNNMSNYILRESTRNKEILYMLESVFIGENINKIKSILDYHDAFDKNMKKIKVFGLKFIYKKKGIVLSFGDMKIPPLAYSFTAKKIYSNAEELYEAYLNAKSFDECYAIFITLLSELNVEVKKEYIISAFEEGDISKVMAFWEMMDNEIELLMSNRK